MKKIFIILLAAVLVLSVAACTNTPADTETTTENTTSTTEEITTTEETTEEITTAEETTEEITEQETTEEVTTKEETTTAETEENDGKYVFEGVSMILPEGFSVVSAQGLTLAVFSDYPEHSDNISFVAGSDEFSSYTKEALESTFNSLFGSVENFTFESKSEADYDLVTAAFDVTYNGVAMHEKSCSYFFSGKSVTISFTSVSGEFDEAFEQTFQSIQIEK